MQPDPATPRSLLLNGLTDEERAGLMAIEAARQAQASSTPHATTPAVKKAAPNRGNTRPRAGAPDAPTPTTPASPAVQISPSLYTSPLRIGGTLVSLSDADPSAPAEGDCPLLHAKQRARQLVVDGYVDAERNQQHELGAGPGRCKHEATEPRRGTRRGERPQQRGDLQRPERGLKHPALTRRLTIIEEEPKERVDEAKPRNDRHGELDAQLFVIDVEARQNPPAMTSAGRAG